MKNYIKQDEWAVIEEGFHPEFNEVTESLMSLGNGRMGQRGNFEEKYSGKTLQGNYIAGVWFPDKTRVGWWKNGYPNYFAKVINATNWIGLDIEIDEVELDLAQCEILQFMRVLDMKAGTLKRLCTLRMANGHELEIESERFCSMSHDEAGMINYSIRPLNFVGKLKLTSYLDGDVSNRDANHGEKFWEEIDKEVLGSEAYLCMKTKVSPWENVPRFTITSGMRMKFFQEDKPISPSSLPVKHDKYVACQYELPLVTEEKTIIQKFVVNLSSENHAVDQQLAYAKKYLNEIYHLGFEVLLGEHKDAWAKKWELNDIVISGDVAAQQGIRFNIFHLQQTYTGEDPRLNIGPKGFTGEKYGGVTYWDTEAYCLPFYLATAEQKVARNLLEYRYKHLQKAIENAGLLGFDSGAALYPMVTMNGEECHNEWEITFEEIHRNGAIAYAIYDYTRYTGDESYLLGHGLEVLIGISRFWSQRVNWSEAKQKFVMLGVTGPNEYENNVNNNWYTNTIAQWTLRYTLAGIEKAKTDTETWEALKRKLQFREEEETGRWAQIVAEIHLPEDKEKGVFLQQDGFLDKELLTVDQIPEHRPINQKWSWDRILRSCFIKQADVLQGLYFFEEDYSLEQLQRNFDFYEPMTVHESSLSPCVHTILACKLKRVDQAYDLYVRTARLDLDDYNNDTEDGLHITAMAGAWMAVVKGFGGMRIQDGSLSFDPVLPESWKSYSFRVGFRGLVKEVKVSKEGVEIKDLKR
ncbi:glycoside hydrolase family 65 protein [Marinilongibacter aquaticus]|uniref:family 65 glycosyl hydrolase domain-containing protein n=1 Tax=Marinilongibacter aquaticus TaxID=2975157 RepID=UPI0021BDD78E|nr:family 65 glycosyl hydrolase domain-containing protein [Marinilongibacter aquaticus]UBM59242.1 glycoside hydrolase family 65 protein [Marinilongibacter aquaticus]